MNPVLVAVVAAVIVLLVACLVTWLVGGTVGTRLARRRDERETAGWMLGDHPTAHEDDDEPCCIHPSYAYSACPLGFDDPDPVHGHPVEASAADAAKLRGDWDRIGRDMERALDAWPPPAPGDDPNREITPETDAVHFDDAYWSKIPTQRRRP